MAASEFSAPVLTANPTVGAVELLWGAVAGALRYELSSWTSAAGWQPLGGDDLTATTYPHTGLTVGTTYYYWVRAVSASGDNTAWSERVSATVPSTLSPTATSTPTATPTATLATTPNTTPTATANRNPNCNPNFDRLRVFCPGPDCRGHRGRHGLELGRRGRRSTLSPLDLD